MLLRIFLVGFASHTFSFPVLQSIIKDSRRNYLPLNVHKTIATGMVQYVFQKVLYLLKVKDSSILLI